jgi:hypothetical protein
MAGHSISVRTEADHGFRPRQPVSLGFDMSKASLFDVETEQRL